MTAVFDPWAKAACKVGPWPWLEAKGTGADAWRQTEREYAGRVHAAYEAALARHAAEPGIYSPRDQVKAAEECLRLRAAIEAGDGGAVLDAVAQCAAYGLVMPAWLADAFLQRHGAVGKAEARDWSDERAFGKAYPKGANIAGVRAFLRHAGPAYQTAVQLLAADPERPVDRGLYEEVGKILGVGQTRVQELIAEYLAHLDGYRPPLSDLRARLRSGRNLDEAFSDWDKERFAAFCEKMLGLEYREVSK